MKFLKTVLCRKRWAWKGWKIKHNKNDHWKVKWTLSKRDTLIIKIMIKWKEWIDRWKIRWALSCSSKWGASIMKPFGRISLFLWQIVRWEQSSYLRSENLLLQSKRLYLEVSIIKYHLWLDSIYWRTLGQLIMVIMDLSWWGWHDTVHPVARWSPMLGEDHFATSWVWAGYI